MKIIILVFYCDNFSQFSNLKKMWQCQSKKAKKFKVEFYMQIKKINLPKFKSVSSSLWTAQSSPMKRFFISPNPFDFNILKLFQHFQQFVYFPQFYHMIKT